MAQLNPAIMALKQYVPGRFGPEDAIQGPFGRDLSMSQPEWARWFDAVQENAPGGISGIGASRKNPSVQPGMGDTTLASTPTQPDPFSGQELGQTDPTTGYRKPVQGLVNAYRSPKKVRI